MAICHFSSHGKRHQFNELSFFLNFRDSQTGVFQYTHAHVFFLSSARVTWECTYSSQINHNCLPAAKDKQLSSLDGYTPGRAAATKGGGWNPSRNGFQPMKTKHGRQPVTHKPVIHRIIKTNQTESTQMSDVKTSKPGCKVLKLQPLPLLSLDRQTDLTEKKT